MSGGELSSGELAREAFGQFNIPNDSTCQDDANNDRSMTAAKFALGADGMDMLNGDCETYNLSSVYASAKSVAWDSDHFEDNHSPTNVLDASTSSSSSSSHATACNYLSHNEEMPFPNGLHIDSRSLHDKNEDPKQILTSPRTSSLSSSRDSLKRTRRFCDSLSKTAKATQNAKLVDTESAMNISSANATSCSIAKHINPMLPADNAGHPLPADSKHSITREMSSNTQTEAHITRRGDKTISFRHYVCPVKQLKTGVQNHIDEYDIASKEIQNVVANTANQINEVYQEVIGSMRESSVTNMNEHILMMEKKAAIFQTMQEQAAAHAKKLMNYLASWSEKS